MMRQNPTHRRRPKSGSIFRCAFVGDSAVRKVSTRNVTAERTSGQTSLQVAFASNGCPTVQEVSCWTHYCHLLNVDGREYGLAYYEVTACDNYARLRPLIYSVVDVFVCCFNLDSHIAISRLRHHWIPELRKFCPEAPIVIAGTYADLRDDPTIDPETLISLDDGYEFAKEVGARAYIECSARTVQGVKAIIHEALFAAVDAASDTTSRRCIIA